MKNDFDFIKEKIDHSGIQAPGEMDDSFVLDTLSDVQPKVVALKPKRRWKTAAVAAAAFVLVAAVGTAVGVHLHNRSLEQRLIQLPGGLAVRQFSSREEIKSAVKDIRKANEKQTNLWDYTTLAGEYLYGMLDSKGAAMDYAESAEDIGALNGGATAPDSAAASSGNSGGVSHSDTYKQVDGVDEADIIKTDGRYIYCVDGFSSTEIIIFSVDGENSEKVAVINIDDAFDTADTDATEDEADFPYETYYRWKYRSLCNMYLRNNRLIAVCNEDNYGSSKTEVLVYDVSDINNITLLSTVSQSGYYGSSRMIGDTIYTVSNYDVYGDDIIPLCGVCENGSTPEEVPADCVYAMREPTEERFLVVSAYDTLSESSQTESRAILGTVDDVYCNLDNLYIYATHYAYHDDGRYGGYYWEDVTTQILKVSLTDGLSFTGYTEVKGYVDDQYALDEYNDNLRVATTTTENGVDQNNLFVYDANMNPLGSVNGFAKNESIKAVRYVGDTAYVITYEQTDPLFVIDLSDPRSPDILGEVKISGFSTMLVPIDENTLLGIGYHTENEDYTTMEVQEGLKLALFDVSDKANPQMLDSISYVDCDSEVQYNPKALVYNPDRGDFIIPLNYHHYGYTYNANGGYYAYENEEFYGGMLNFKVENGRLQEIFRYRADYEEDVQRCVYVGDTVYMTYYDDYYELSLDSVKYQ